MQQSTSRKPKHIKQSTDMVIKNTIFVTLSCPLCYSVMPFMVGYHLVRLLELLVLECRQQFTILLACVDGASFIQFALVVVWHSFIQVYINFLDLLQSIVRGYYITFCQARIYLTRENNQLHSYCYVWWHIISTLQM